MGDVLHRPQVKKPENGLAKKPLLTLADICGEDINYCYASQKATELGMLSMGSFGEAVPSMIIGSKEVYDSTVVFPLASIKKIVRGLHNNVRIRPHLVSIHYGLQSSRCFSYVCFRLHHDYNGKNNIYYLAIRSFRVVEGKTVPEKYKDLLSSDGKLYLPTNITMSFSSENYEGAKEVANFIRTLCLPKGMSEFETPTVEIITMNSSGLDLREVEINGSTISEEMMELHYGEDFPNFDKTLITEMEKKNKGVVLFHGPPGNGKTYYIRHLVSRLRDIDKRVIIVPKHVLAEMESPQFNNFMIDEFSDCDDKAVFVVEDAEAVLRARDSEGDGRAVVSTILNLSDGILNDIFKVQLICTFNTDLQNIDSALLRPGRLLAMREFLPLDKENAQKLLDKLDIKKEAEEDMSLATIYASGEEESNNVLTKQKIKKPKKKLGFC